MPKPRTLAVAGSVCLLIGAALLLWEYMSFLQQITATTTGAPAESGDPAYAASSAGIPPVAMVALGIGFMAASVILRFTGKRPE